MRIDPSVNVGIGTNNPYTSLTVGSSDATAFITPGGPNTHLTLQTVGASGAVRFYTICGSKNNVASTEIMRIDAGGNIGNGTTSPADKLDIKLTTSGSAGGITLGDTYQFARLYDATGGHV